MNRKCRPLAQLAVDVERAAMVAHNMLDDGEAQPGSAELAGARRVDTVEALGEARNIVARNAWAAIPDCDRDGWAALARSCRRQGTRRGEGRHFDIGRGGAVFDRV